VADLLDATRIIGRLVRHTSVADSIPCS